MALCRGCSTPADPSFHLADRYHGVMFLAEAAAHAGRVREAREVIAGLEAEAATTPAPNPAPAAFLRQGGPGRRRRGRGPVHRRHCGPT